MIYINTFTTTIIIKVPEYMNYMNLGSLERYESDRYICGTDFPVDSFS